MFEKPRSGFFTPVTNGANTRRHSHSFHKSAGSSNRREAGTRNARGRPASADPALYSARQPARCPLFHLDLSQNRPPVSPRQHDERPAQATAGSSLLSSSMKLPNLAKTWQRFGQLEHLQRWEKKRKQQLAGEQQQQQQGPRKRQQTAASTAAAAVAIRPAEKGQLKPQAVDSSVRVQAGTDAQPLTAAVAAGLKARLSTAPASPGQQAPTQPAAAAATQAASLTRAQDHRNQQQRQQLLQQRQPSPSPAADLPPVAPDGPPTTLNWLLTGRLPDEAPALLQVRAGLRRHCQNPANRTLTPSVFAFVRALCVQKHRRPCLQLQLPGYGRQPY